jgi:hypothetical protein
MGAPKPLFALGARGTLAVQPPTPRRIAAVDANPRGYRVGKDQGGRMKIGEPIRTYVVEPLEEPATSDQPEDEEKAAAEAVAVGTEREPMPAA